MKHLLTLALLLCLGTFASAQIPSYVPTNGLVGWWPFNGNANDESGNGNHGTVNGATLAADRFGNAGKAYFFNHLDEIQTGFNLISGNQPRTFSFWMKNQNSSKTITPIWYGGNPTQPVQGTGWVILFNRNEQHDQCNCWPTIYQGVGVAADWVYSLRSAVTGDNIWHNWVVILETAGQNFNQIKYYKDGILITSNIIFDYNNNGNTVVNTNNSNPLKFGKSLGNSSNPDKAPTEYLDDIAIYNRALTAAEVQQLYLGNCTQPTFTAQPQNKTVAQGQTTTFAVQVDTTATFQWQMNLGLGAGWVNIPQSSLFSGDTTATLSVQGRSTIDGAQFRCIATACQSDTSNAATLTVTSNTSTLGSVAGVPGKINYQGAAVDSLGKPMKNQTIALKLSVLDSSSTGAAAYVETHSTPTNGNGLFSLQIGGGTAVTGSFDSIPWANGRNKYLKTEVQQNGTWINLGTSQLVSVPYALVAGKAIEATSATFFKDSLGNAYQIKTVNGQPTLVSAPGNVSSPGTFACGQAVTYAGESYPTVQIGTQCWFAKNLNVGSMVQGANDQTNNGVLEKYCYNNDTANCSIYGGLYQWAEAVQYQNGASNTTSPNPAFTGNIKGICPTGWHVPSDGELSQLETFLGGTLAAGGALKSISSLWASPNLLSSNISQFSGLPSGNRNTNGLFYYIGNYTNFWSTSESSVTNSFNRNLGYNYSDFYRSNDVKDFGFSVRCLKD